MADEDVWIIGGPWSIVEGEEFQKTITWNGYTTLSSLDDAMFRLPNENTEDSTLTASGTPSATVNVYTTQKWSGFKGGNRYILVITATADGLVEKRKAMLVCQRKGHSQ